MAEAIGLILGLAGLYSSCIDAFEQVRAARSFGRDYEILSTRFDVRKARFLQWGDGVGLLYDAHEGRHPHLDSPSLRPAVERVLHCIEMLLSDTERFQAKYGIQEDAYQEPLGEDTSMCARISSRRRDLFKSSYAQFLTRTLEIQRGTSLARKTRWAITGREDFERLISDLDGMIEDLYKLIPVQPAFRKLMVEEDINNLPEDLAALKLVQEACAIDAKASNHGLWLEVASIRMEATENSTRNERQVIEWMAGVPEDTLNGDVADKEIPRDCQERLKCTSPSSRRVDVEERATRSLFLNPRASSNGQPTTAHDFEDAVRLRLQAKWEKQMEHISFKKKPPNPKVEVLLLYWTEAKADLSDLETVEIDELRRVFLETYNFHVHECVLKSPDHRDTKVLIQYHLSKFVLDHDADDTLLIVYYIGCGSPPETLRLTRTSSSDRQSGSRRVEIEELGWLQTDTVFQLTIKSDVLVILDCCFAGRLAHQASQSLSSTRNLDYIGSCGSDQWAAASGSGSFTNALTQALEVLATDTEAFTILELLNKIKECPTFQKYQQTPWFTSKSGCPRRLQLAPLKNFQGQLRTLPPNFDDAAQATALDYCLSLDFLLPKLPTDEEMISMCEGLKTLISREQLLAQKIIWKSMYRIEDRSVPAVAKAAALKWRAQTLLNRKKSNQSTQPIKLASRD